MAKSTSSRGGPSRIRFIMVEADLQEGDLEQVTQVLQNAFRTTQVVPARPQTARLASKISAQPLDEHEEEVLDPAEEGEQDEMPTVVRSRTPRKSRPARVPSIVDNLDTKTDPSLKDFVAGFDLKTTFDRYLVIALWLREARSTNSFTVDHIYTCFKILSWSTNSNDFSKPLQNLKSEQALSGDSKGFSLSLTGAGKIEDKKRGEA